MGCVSSNGQLDSTGVYSVEVDFIRNCVEGAHNVLVDLSNVSYISSIGISMSNSVLRKWLAAREIGFIEPQHNVLDVLNCSGSFSHHPGIL